MGVRVIVGVAVAGSVRVGPGVVDGAEPRVGVV